MAFYLDSSAITKLLLREDESDSLNAFLKQRPERISSALVRVEVERARVRAGSSRLRFQYSVLAFESINMLAISDSILARAAVVGPPELRSLDAIHLATALSIPGLDGMVVYARRLARAAQAAGLHVWAPGQDAIP